MTTAREVAERLGGQEVLREQVCTDLQLVTAILRGLPAASADALLATGGLTAAELHTLVVFASHADAAPSNGTAAHAQCLGPPGPDHSRAPDGGRSVWESDKSYRWLRKPNRALGGRVPLELLTTEPGARLVEDSLERIAHGIFA